MDRSGSIYAPRSLFHGQALHAQTNCTSPSPLSLPYNGAPSRMLTVIIPSFYLIFALASFSRREDCGSNSLVRRHHRNPLSAPTRVADHDYPRLRNDNKLHKHNKRSWRRRRRRIAIHPGHRDAPSVALMHRHTRRTAGTHL